MIWCAHSSTKIIVRHMADPQYPARKSTRRKKGLRYPAQKNGARHKLDSSTPQPASPAAAVDSSVLRKNRYRRGGCCSSLFMLRRCTRELCKYTHPAQLNTRVHCTTYCTTLIGYQTICHATEHHASPPGTRTSRRHRASEQRARPSTEHRAK